MRCAVIMAGGSGTRLWPLSRADRPKQLLRLFGGQSLLRQAFERIAGLLPAEHIFVITLARHLPLVARELPELPIDNLIGEPEGRDTANAIALAAALLERRDPAGSMAVLTADHVITPADHFREALSRAFAAAEAHPAALVTLGVPPQRPETAFGYVQRGPRVGEGLYRVAHFAEKPDLAAAQSYVSAGDYYWNSGTFVWRIEAIVSELRRCLPDSHRGTQWIADDWDTARREHTLATVYPGLPRISIDFAVMEKAKDVLVVEMDCQWADVGSWSQLAAVVPEDADGNVLAAESVVPWNSRGVTCVSEDPGHLVVAVGVDDLIIVHSGDATLVCRKSEAQSLKELVARVRQRFGGKYV